MPKKPPKNLIFGHMPKSATPKTHTATGAWCFSGQEELFPHWWDSENTTGYFPLPDDPFTTTQEIINTATHNLENTTVQAIKNNVSHTIENTAAQANAEILRLLPSLSQYLNTFHKKEYSAQFWELALGPWLLLITHVLVERQKRVADLIQLYGNEQLIVPIVPNEPNVPNVPNEPNVPNVPNVPNEPNVPNVQNAPIVSNEPASNEPHGGWNFTDSLDFIQRGVLDTNFNHFIYSRILESMAPSTWQLVPLNLVQSFGSLTPDGATVPSESIAPSTFVTSATPQTSFSLSLSALKKNNLLKKAKNKLSSLLQGMPFPFMKGFSLWMSCLLSFKVMQYKAPHNRAYSLNDFSSTPVLWQFDAPTLIKTLLPKCFYEPLPSIPNSTNKLRGMVPAFSQNDRYRMRMAAWQAGGGKLFCVQHGANYGNLSSVGISIFEYMQHAFFSWGFTKHATYPINATPTIHPMLAKLYNTHKTTTPHLIFVGTEMSTHAYRLKTRPYAKKLVQYRQAKTTFLRALPKEIFEHVLYRPYFASCSSLSDYSFIQENFPTIHRCTGNLNKHTKQGALTVLDHYGTTLHTCFATNTPTVCFWAPTDWGMTPATQEVLHHLQEAKILHPTPEKAATHIQQIWSDIPTWWHSDKIQQARNVWLQHFALCCDTTHTPLTNWQLFRLWSKIIATCP